MGSRVRVSVDASLSVARVRDGLNPTMRTFASGVTNDTAVRFRRFAFVRLLSRKASPGLNSFHEKLANVQYKYGT
jgi:TolB-like protein